MNDLLVAVCTLGTVRAEWAASLATARPPMGRAQALVLVQNLPVVQARNKAIEVARARGAEYLLFWDDDMIPCTDNAMRQLMAVMEQRPEMDVLGGVYPLRVDVATPCVVEEQGRGPFWGWRDGAVHRVYMTGTGFMLLRLARLPEVCFVDREDESDDFIFAERCAAIGLTQYVHGGVHCQQIDRSTGRMYRLPELVAVA